METPLHTDERELLVRMRQGDQHAFEQVHNQYAKLLAYKLTKLIKIPEVVQELHQDVFMRLWDARGHIQEDTHLKAYLYTIARNLVIDFYRKVAKQKELEQQLAQHVNLSYDHIEPLLSSKETEAVLDQLIGMLPPQRQKIFRMIKQEGKTYEETSLQLGLSINTVKDHMRKSMDFLKGQLSRNYPHITFCIAATLLYA